MNTSNHQRTGVNYAFRPALGASETPMALPGDVEPVFYEVFDANIALIECSIGNGTIAVRRGAVVTCATTYLGFVSGFLLDTSNGAISHLLLRNAVPAEQSDQIVPVSEIISCEADKILLR